MLKSFISRRRTFIINNDLQYRLIFSFFFNIFLFFAVVGLGLFTPLFIELGEKSGYSSAIVQQAASVLLYLHATFWPVALFSFLLIGLLSLRTSHRMAGPLYRITLILKSLENGNLPKPILPRKGDYLIAELEVANQMLEKLRLQMREIQEGQASLHDSIVACGKVIGHAAPGELIERMKDIQEKESQIADRLDYFKVE
jgi:sensor histidine kinase YesM